MAVDGAELEGRISALYDRGDYAGAAVMGLRGYGPEIYGFLVSFLKSEDQAADVFAAFSERLWRGLPNFDWESSFRTWAYTIARNTMRTHKTKARRQALRELPMPSGSKLSAIAEEVRSATKSYLRSETKARVARLREALSADDQMLLSLRVDRQLSFQEVARIMHDGDLAPTPKDVVREAARLRKQFQTIKERLRALAARAKSVD